MCRMNPSDVRLLRVLDAGANRAAEGLRVIEDYVRFGLDDRHLTSLVKALRHDLAAALSTIATTDRLAARESLADVGAELKAAAEFDRPEMATVVTASFRRVEQSLRSLEEFAKTIDVATAAQLETLRYRTYTLERAVDITRTSLDRLAGARLYVLVDGRPSEEDFRTLTTALVTAGAHVLQLRDKSLNDRTLLLRARLMRELTRGTQTLFIVNDRPDLAVLADADGVHVGQDELTVKDARAIIGARRLIGVSTHSIEQARQAVLAGANYIGVGPTFPSSTKQFTEFPGLKLIRTVSAEIRLPTFVIGGITHDNLPEVLAAGAQRIAVSGPLLTAADPAEATRSLLKKLDR
jgi:thiamine-phosphate pyrophosphorylase